MKLKPSLSTSIKLPSEQVQSEINLSETIEISQSQGINQKKYDDEPEEEGVLAPIKCDDDGPDFSLMTRQGKVSAGEI